LATAAERFSAKIDEVVGSLRDGLKSASVEPEPEEFFVLITTVSLYDGISRVVSDVEAAAADVRAAAEKNGCNASKIAVESGVTLDAFMRRLTEIRMFCLDAVYSVEITEDERRNVLIQVIGYVDGFLTGLYSGYSEGIEDARSADDEDGVHGEYKRYFARHSVPAVLVDGRGFVKGMNDAAAVFFDIAPENAVNRAYEDVLGTGRLNLNGVDGDVATRRARVLRNGTEIVVEVQIVKVGDVTDYTVLAFFDLTERERLASRLMELERVS